VLIIESDERTLLAARTALDGTGLRVLVATSTAEALYRLQGAGEAVDLMVADASLQCSEGVGLVEEVRRKWPALTLVLLSDVAGDDIRVANLDRDPVLVVRRPFRPETLRIAVHASLLGQELPG
jgi:DNA-binding response OmpR family regulator